MKSSSNMSERNKIFILNGVGWDSPPSQKRIEDLNVKTRLKVTFTFGIASRGHVADEETAKHVIDELVFLAVHCYVVDFVPSFFVIAMDPHIIRSSWPVLSSFKLFRSKDLNKELVHPMTLVLSRLLAANAHQLRSWLTDCLKPPRKELF